MSLAHYRGAVFSWQELFKPEKPKVSVLARCRAWWQRLARRA